MSLAASCQFSPTSFSVDADVSPSDLPLTGTTPFPVINNNSVDVALHPVSKGADQRYKSANLPEPLINGVALHQLLTQLEHTLDEEHFGLIGVPDSTQQVWRYGYVKLEFTSASIDYADGRTRTVVYTRITEEGIKHIMAARIPDSPAAFRALRTVLDAPIPGDRLRPVHTSMQKGLGATTQRDSNEQWCWSLDGMGFETFGPEYCVDSIFVDSERPPATEFELCAGDDLFCGGDSDKGDGYGLIHCFTDPHACYGGSSVAPSHDCNGVLDGNAFKDHCDRCVGGDTQRFAAPADADCNNLNIPCAGDVVKNPEITSSGASGKTGGRFRPCMEGVSPGGASGGWQGPNCTDEDRAARNNGLDAHHGLDLTCNVGDPIYAPFDLDNVNTGFLQGVGYGNYLRGWTMIDGTRYNFGIAHLQNRPPVPADGKFKQGDIIGYCGRSGIPNTASGRRVTTHVHVEMGTESTLSSMSRVFLVNPEPFLLTQFSTDSTATPVNPDPCNQN
ncbi:MAG: M23 family metallopeptidase [Bacteroidetes bacterium]|nr:M23 family metallopeptidase [Bacteroidota bacterium]MCH8525500.1 M23 family metallopeptidase [Balneolales bacterium]